MTRADFTSRLHSAWGPNYLALQVLGALENSAFPLSLLSVCSVPIGQDKEKATKPQGLKAALGFCAETPGQEGLQGKCDRETV